ncbi:MAG: hypothetical protein HZB81_03755 [Deltaproteobacteria bacterium]|nr:hypothetical protein [Deltaproteobacteria bacterium]
MTKFKKQETATSYLVPKQELGNIIVKEAPASCCSSYRRLRLNSGSWNFQNNSVPKLGLGNEEKGVDITFSLTTHSDL